jgi:hypothetical protein
MNSPYEERGHKSQRYRTRNWPQGWKTRPALQQHATTMNDL